MNTEEEIQEEMRNWLAMANAKLGIDADGDGISSDGVAAEARMTSIISPQALPPWKNAAAVPDGLQILHNSQPPKVRIDGAPLYTGKLFMIEMPQDDDKRRQWHIKAYVNESLKQKDDIDAKMATWFAGLRVKNDPYGEDEARAAYHGVPSKPYNIIAVVTTEDNHLRFYSPIKLDLCLRYNDDQQHNEIRFEASNNDAFVCQLCLEHPPAMYIIDGKISLLPY